MVPLPDPAFIVAVISAAFDGIQTWLALKDRRKTSDVLNASFAKTRDDPNTIQQADALAELVPDDVLASMVDRVRRCWDKYKEVIDSEEDYLPGEIDNATEAIQRCICRELARIRKLNKTLPAGDLQKWWRAYCAT